MGTADYIAPEQALNSKNADHRADIYSLGCTMFYAFTGQTMYLGETSMERIVAHREQEIPSLRAMRDDVNPDVDRIFQRMVAKSPDDRYQLMKEVVRDMKKCLDEFGHMWMIKRFIAEHSRDDPVYAGLPDVPAHARARLRRIGRLRRPSAAEVAANPRARSARLRIAERCAELPA